MRINIIAKLSVFLILFILIIPLSSFEQTFKHQDSLQKALDDTREDSTRILLLIKLIDDADVADTSRLVFLFNRITEELESKKIKFSPNYLFSVGLLFEEKKNDLLQAVKFYELAMQAAFQSDNIAWVYYESWLGYTLSKTGEHEKALFHLLKATEAAESKNLSKNLPGTYTMLAFGYREVKDLGKAEFYFNKAIDASLNINDSTYIHTALHEIGNIYCLKKDFKNAISYHKKALSIREKLNVSALLVYSYHDIANDYFNIDSIETALSFFYKAEYYSQQEQNVWMIFKINANIISSLLALNNFKEAHQRLLKVQELAEQMNFKSAYMQLYDLWYNYYRNIGQYEQALHYYETAKIYNDSISNEQINKNIIELDKKYESAKKDKELIKKQSHIKRQQTIIFFIIILSVIITFFLILVFIQFRQKKAANKKLEFQNHEIFSQKEELLVQAETLQKINLQLVEQRNEIEVQREKLFELNATKDKFFSIIAHDLKNPFNSLIGMSDLLRMSAFNMTPEKVQKFAQTMNTSSKQAYTLLENLLEWSRLQTGKLKPKFSVEKPSQHIHEVKTLLEATANAKNIYLISDIIDDDSVIADTHMLKTVLRNLVSNALKFTFAEGTIKIECQKNGNEMVFSVTDTGTGIEPEHINKLFRIDSKLSRNGTADEKGTGLGLILCKEFIEKQNGRIWAESEVGKGSTFGFTVPVGDQLL